MKHLLAFLLSTTLVANAFAQQKRDVAKQHLEQLQNGALFVRLSTGEHQLAALRKEGLMEQAEEKERQIWARNLEIMQAFQSAFTFCPVYFFFSSDLDAIQAGNFEDVLLDAELKAGYKMVQEPTHIFIAEIGNTYFEAFGSYMQALAVYDSEMKLLDEPFPNLVRQRAGNPMLERTALEMVEKWSTDLHSLRRRWLD